MPSQFPIVDRVFLAIFVFFALVAFVHEPLFYYYCGWEALADGSCADTPIGSFWMDYARLDPAYFDMPLWAQLQVDFDILLFGPFYAYSIWAFWKHRVDTPAYRAIAIAVCGGMIYAMILYVTWEVLTAAESGAALGEVIGYNIPWGIVPLLLVVRLYLGMRIPSR